MPSVTALLALVIELDRRFHIENIEVNGLHEKGLSPVLNPRLFPKRSVICKRCRPLSYLFGKPFSFCR